MCTIGVLGLSCAARSGGAAGVSHGGPRTPNVHISGIQRFKHHQHSTRRPLERQKGRNGGGKGKKKREILGGPAEVGPAEGGGSGGEGSGGEALNTPTKQEHKNTQQHRTTHSNTYTHNKQTNKNEQRRTPTHQNQPQQHKKKGLAKNGLAKIGKPLTTNL